MNDLQLPGGIGTIDDDEKKGQDFTKKKKNIFSTLVEYFRGNEEDRYFKNQNKHNL